MCNKYTNPKGTKFFFGKGSFLENKRMALCWLILFTFFSLFDFTENF